jgi:hypothetical protein
MDGCRVCFAAREYATGPNAQLLHGALLRITEVFLPDTANRSMRHLYHRNCGYAYADVVDNLCLLHHILEFWKKPTCLSTDHPVHELDTSLSHLKNKPIQLRFDSSKNTLVARDNSASRPIGLVGHILTTSIHFICLLEKPSPSDDNTM